MTREQTIFLQLIDESNKPLALSNVIMVIHFFTNGNYRYGFKLPPTDNQGQLRISYDDIDAKRMESGSESLMDYNTPLADSDPQIRIEIPTDGELRSHPINTSCTQYIVV